MQGLKERYAGKWRVSVKREHFIYNYLNWLLAPHGYVLEWAGLGAGSSEYIGRYYSGVEEALDFRIYDSQGRLIGFLDATGYADPKRGVVDGKRCVGTWKLYKALEIEEKLGIGAERVWYAHFTDSKHILVFINARRLRGLVDKGVAEKRVLVSGEKPSYCLPLKYWLPPSRFLALLRQLRH